jgi:hypothetical protein
MEDLLEEFVRTEEPATLEHLMRDYVGHPKSHPRQVFGG